MMKSGFEHPRSPSHPRAPALSLQAQLGIMSYLRTCAQERGLCQFSYNQDSNEVHTGGNGSGDTPS